MAEAPRTRKKDVTPDWFVHGVLTKIGDTFDRFLGRGWKPSSSLATSELIERLKALLDSEVKENASKAKFVPHNIKLKMQWDKFATDSASAMNALVNELLAAAVDHINDRRYLTLAPLAIEVKPDYFTSGVKLYVSFEKFADDVREAELSVSMPGTAEPAEAAAPPAAEREATFTYTVAGRPIAKTLRLSEDRRVSLGRTKENSISIDDPSVSKVHASLKLTADGRLVIADTGSTNGTFVNDTRIAYGKAVEVGGADKLRFGSVDVAVEIAAPTMSAAETEPAAATEKYVIGDMEFSGGADNSQTLVVGPAEETTAEAPAETTST